jgi:predicted secreted protein
MQTHLIRRGSISVLFFVCVMAQAAPFWAAQPSPPFWVSTIILTEQDNGKTGMAARGQSLQVNLRGNPSTGFQWILAATNGTSVVPSGSSTFTPDVEGGVGSPGLFSFPFQVAEYGNTTLTFDYLQPWNPQNVLQTFVVTIQVGDMMPQELSVRLEGTNVVITWPIAASSGFYLEGTPGLSPPQWAALNALVVPDGFNYKVILSSEGNGLFFRLRL